MEFSEMFTQSARRVLPVARARQFVSYLDYSGPYFDLTDGGAGMPAGMHRLMLAALDCMASGFVLFQADVGEPVGDHADVTVHAAATGASAPRQVIESVLERLGMQPAHPAAQGPAGRHRHARGRCPASGAEVEFVDEGVNGRVLTMRVSLRGSPIAGAAPRPDAGAMVAWLVSAIPGALNSVERRLRRLGWRTVQLASLDRLAALGTASGDASPMLLIVAETTGTELADLERAAATRPALWPLLAVVAGSPSLKVRDRTRVDIRELPLSPMEIEDITEHFDLRTSTVASRTTSPAPLYEQSPGVVLIVDDNEVNLMIAGALMESLGYEVEVALDGAQALTACHRRAPDAVLMDVHMPVMDGLQATRQLRAEQRIGELPPFPVVAATTAEDAQTLAQCRDAGMDGILAKPLSPQLLADEIHRVLPARAAPHRH